MVKRKSDESIDCYKARLVTWGFSEISKFRDDIFLRLEMKDLVEFNIFLGLEVMNTKEDIFISQTSYTKKYIERFRINKSKKISTPLDANIKLRCNDGKLLSDPRSFHTFIGSLIYLTITRNHFVQSPKKSQLDAAKRSLKYVNSTLDLGSFYKNDIHLELHGYVNVDLGGDIDNRRSTSDCLFIWFCLYLMV
ncbi:unnamed protein product [Musa acuminata var. zebrina]